MLVLSRKCAEVVQVGESIRITVVQVDRGRVRVGIEAPPDVAVLRGELAGLVAPAPRRRRGGPGHQASPGPGVHREPARV